MSEVRLSLRGGRTLRITVPEGDVAPIFSDGWLSSELWPAAEALMCTLQEDEWQQWIAQSSHCIELGAGTGACGLAASSLGAMQVTLTDKAPAAALPLPRPILKVAGGRERKEQA